MNSIETVSNIKKISFIFFAVLGIAHFLFGSLFAISAWLPNSFLAMKISFIPFVIASISYVYGVTKEKLLLGGKTTKIVDYLFLIFGVIIVAAFLVIDFLYPDVLQI